MKRKNKLVYFLEMAVIAVFAVFYIRNQSLNLLSAPMDYEVAVAVTSEEAIEADCYIMKNETILTTPYSGAVLPAVEDGGRVAKGREAVRVYANSGDINTENEIRFIDRQLEVLEKSKINTSTVETKPDRIDEEIELLIEDAVTANSDNDLQGALKVRDDLLVEMNKRWQYSSEKADFQAKIDALNASRQRLRSSLASSGYTVSAPVAGYYFSDVDGFESIFSSALIDKMTLDSFDVMTSTPAMAYSGNVCGKLVTDHRWYTACKVTTAQAYYFDEGKSYDIEFSASYGTVLQMELARKIEENGRDEAVLVFVSASLPQGFDYTRKQPIRIVYNAYTGLKVPKEAVRVVDGVKGVYVSGGTTVKFKLICDIYTIEDYYIVDSNKENYPAVVKSKEINEDGSENITYYQVLSLYDRVITENKELYDGMPIR